MLLFSSAYNEYTVISKEYTGSLEFDITGVDCIVIAGVFCRFHFAELLSFVDAPLAGSKAACTTLANILLKAHVLNVSDKEKSLGCLRRQDKLSN